jgi:hypothetical protein
VVGPIAAPPTRVPPERDPVVRNLKHTIVHPSGAAIGVKRLGE